MTTTATNKADDPKLAHDAKTLCVFVQFFCRHRHADREISTVHVKGVDIEGIMGRPVAVCKECQSLLMHAIVKRLNCPLDPKPRCKKCATHCYAPKYREQIRDVMRYSGRGILLRGRLDYFFKLFF